MLFALLFSLNLWAQNPVDVVDAWTINTGSNSITTSAYDEIEDSTTQLCKQLMASNQTSSHLIIATGADGSEIDKWVIPPNGGFSTLYVNIPTSTRVSLKALDANATSGWVAVQCYY